MSRPKAKNSKLSFGNLGLSPTEDKKLIALLKKKDTSLARVMREAVRSWMKYNSK